MIVKVMMLANSPFEGQVRDVEIPDETPPKDMLDAVWQAGQNDFHPVPNCPSVSVGDVVVLKLPVIEIGSSVPREQETPYLIAALGFRRISLVELAEYVRMPRRERQFCALFERGDDDLST